MKRKEKKTRVLQDAEDVTGRLVRMVEEIDEQHHYIRNAYGKEQKF